MKLLNILVLVQYKMSFEAYIEAINENKLERFDYKRGQLGDREKQPALKSYFTGFH